MNPKRGVVYIAFGNKAQEEAQKSVAALRKHNPRLSIMILDNPATLLECSPLASLESASNGVLSRWAKTSLDLWSPYEYTLYLDADTRPREKLTVGFRLLEDEWDLVLSLSENQGHNWLWHIEEEERARTQRLWGFQPLQLQAGVIFFRKCRATKRFFNGWRTAWMQYRGEDQGALLRALYMNRIKIWMLGRPWNGGAVIQHLFGRCRP